MGSYFPLYGPNGQPLYPPQPNPMAPVDPQWSAQQYPAPPPPYAGFGYGMHPQGYMPAPLPVYGAQPPHPFSSPYGMQPAVDPTRNGRNTLVHQSSIVNSDKDNSKDESKKPEMKSYANVSKDFPELDLAERVDLQKQPLNFPLEKQAADRKKDAPHQQKIEGLMKNTKGGWAFKPGKQYACQPDNGRGFTVRLPYTKGANCTKCIKPDHTETQHGKFSLHFFDRNPPPGTQSSQAKKAFSTTVSPKTAVEADKLETHKKEKPLMSKSSRKPQPKETPQTETLHEKKADAVVGYDKVDDLLEKHYKRAHPGIWKVVKAYKDKLADAEKLVASSQNAKTKADAKVQRDKWEEKLNVTHVTHSQSCTWMPEVTQPIEDDNIELSEEDEAKVRHNALDWSKDEDTHVVPTLNSLAEMWAAYATTHGDPSLKVSIPLYDSADSCATDEPSSKSEAKLQLIAWMNDWHHVPEHPQFETWRQGRIKTVQLCSEEVSKLCKGVEHGGAKLSNDVNGKIIKWEQEHQSLHTLLRLLRQKCQQKLIEIEKCGDLQHMRSRNVVTAFVAQLTEDMNFFNDLYEGSLTTLQKDITAAIEKAVTAKAEAEEVADEIDDEGTGQYRESLSALVCAPVLEQLRRIKPRISRAIWFVPRLEYCDFGPEILASLYAPEAPVEVEVP